jgi:hypothetical protein
MIESLKNMENSESYLLQHVKYTHKKKLQMSPRHCQNVLFVKTKTLKTREE